MQIKTKSERVSLKQLKSKLLTLGGERFQVDWFLNEQLPPMVRTVLYHYGEAIEPSNVKYIKMESGQCHAHCETLSQKHGWDWFTGFALSRDGIWRVHSFCLDGTEIIETTESRVRYFGMPRGLFDLTILRALNKKFSIKM